MTSLVVIPARGGSKGIPGKNIKKLGNKPLIQYSIDAAKQLFNEDQIIVSTDDIKIKNCVEQYGLKVPFLRPAHLAQDNSGTYEVLLHAVNYYEKTYHPLDILVLLQPTSPFRSVNHIKEALEMFENEKNVDMVVSVKETKSNPYYVLFEENMNGFLEHSKPSVFKRRQDCPKVWEYNGAIYIINVASLKKHTLSQFQKIKKYEMDEFSSIDIDTNMDWEIAENLLTNKNEDLI